MEVLWFCLLAWMLAMYTVLDGFDLGVGSLHLLVARSERERAQVIRSIGPVWDGNEVWLIAAGGTLFFAFPALFAAAFSGFYLPLILVLWLLAFRALGIELRHQVQDPLWTALWDAAFSLSSLVLSVVLGVALANVVRGVPLDADGVFFEPFWTDFRVGDETGILDWYTVSAGGTAALALAHHGALWLCAKTDGAVRRRAESAADALLPAVAIGAVLVTLASDAVQPSIRANLLAWPWGFACPALAALGLVGTKLLRRAGRPGAAFLCSGAFLAGMLASAAFGIFPYVLPARVPELGLTVHEAAAAADGLRTALFWWVPGMLLACGYAVFVYRSMPRTFSVEADGH